MYSGKNGLKAYTSINNGNGSFATAIKHKVHSGDRGDNYHEFIGDVDGDGLVDLVWMYSGSNGLKAYTSINNGDGSFEDAEKHHVHTDDRGDNYHERLSDVNGDGLVDLVWMYSGIHGLKVYASMNNGDGSFEDAKLSQVNSGERGDNYEYLVGDVNGDGKQDLIWMYSGTWGLTTYASMGRGDGTFIESDRYVLNSGSRSTNYSRFLEDINGDGALDLLWMYSGGKGLIGYSSLNTYSN